VAPIVSLDTIDQTLANLNYRSTSSMKSRLVQAIRAYYVDEAAACSMEAIHAESLIESLWEIEHDPRLVNKKRKNLNSVRSSINVDLQKLFKSGGNPDGITINTDNIFVMSDEAKDKALNSFLAKLPGDMPAGLDQISEILNAINEVLSDPATALPDDPIERLKKLSEMKDLVQGLSDQIDQHGGQRSEVGGLSSEDGATEVGGQKSEDGSGDGDLGPEDGDRKTEDGTTEVGGQGPEDGGRKSEDGTTEDGGQGPEDGGRKSEVGDLKSEGGSGDGDQLTDIEANTDIVEPEDDLEPEDDVEEVEVLEDDEFEEIDELAGGDTDQGLGAQGSEGGTTEVGGQGPEDGSPEDGGRKSEVGGQGSEDGSPEDGGQSSEDGDRKSEVEDLESEVGSGDRDQLTDIEEDTDIIELEDDLEPEDDVEEVEVLEDDEFEEIDDPAEGETDQGLGARGSEDGNTEVGGQGPGNGDQKSEAGDLESEVGSGDGDQLTNIEEDTDIVELEDDVEEVEVLEDDEFEEIDKLAGGDGVSEDGGQKSEVGGQSSGDGGRRSEVGDLESGDGSGDGDNLADVEEDTDIIELEDDVEEVEVLEDDEFEEVDELAGEDRGGDFGEHGDDGSLGSGFEDNHLDAIESGHDPLQPDDPQKARLLAEAFNRSLAAMDKFFNHYIEFPGGEYTVGAETPKNNEILQHTVSLAPFFMGKFPITNALFEVFIENTGYITTAEKIGFGTVYEGRCQTIIDPRTGQSQQIWRADITSKTVEGACWYQPSGTGSTIHNKRNHPVVQVSAHDALAFSAWTGKRLPSEEEWEAATRTIKANIFPWGSDMQSGACNFEESSIGDTTPVDNYPDFENNAGVADALGNILEWAFCPNNAEGATDQSPNYVAKGGSWISNNQPRLYSRLLLEPEMHSNIMGFRCVAS